ncbi:MAG: TRAP transporter large permease subunit [Devosia sp.]
MAPVMFGCLIATLLTGYPVAFSLSAVGLAFAVVGIDLDLFTPTFLQALPDRVYGTMANETLLAIPFFTLMGLLLERSRMAEDLLDTIGQLFGPMRGGLAYAVVFVGAILAATTGVVAASVISMGLISLPIMLRYGYNRSVAAGTIAASGTLAQVVPPSLVLIVLADQLGRSVGEMYRAALAPALIIIVLFALYILVLTLLRPKSVPALPAAARTLQGGARSLVVVLALGVIAALAINALAGGLSPAVRQVVAASGGVSVAVAVALLNRVLGLSLLSELAERVVLVLVPPLALIFLVLGTILIGLATPTEGGAMGALATLILAAVRGRLPLSTLREAVVSTAQLSTFVLFILIGARVFSLSFYGVDGHLWVEDLLVGLPGGVYGFLIFVSVIIFLLGFVLDFFEIAFILLPLLIIPAQALGIDLVWFGIIVAMNLQTSFLTPPFGFSLFFLRSVVPSKPHQDAATGETIAGVRTGEIYRGVVPFIALQVLTIGLVVMFPQIVSVFSPPTVQLEDAAIEDALRELQSDVEFAPMIPTFD